MDFGQALKYLKEGHKVGRIGWRGRGTFIYLVRGTKVPIENLRNEAAEHLKANDVRNVGRKVLINSHIDMKSSDGSIIVGWVASQADMLSEDWEVIK